MDPRLRRLFNAGFAPSLHERVQRDMERRHGLDSFGFRLAETPVFLGPELRDQCERAARGIVAEMSRPEVIARGTERIPERYRVPGTDATPHMAVIDLALARGANGAIVPRLIEAQGFPSLYGMQVLQGDVWIDALATVPGMPSTWSLYFGGLDRASYVALLRRTVIGDADPEETVLLDIHPETQKTRPDFLATEKLIGVRSACITSLVREGRRLFEKRKDGKLAPIRRIYNRVVFDELETKRIAAPFDWREPLDVTWVPHPNWYWIWSKASIPHLRHEAVPAARFLSDVATPPDDLSRFVLKPLFSFAGRGVVVDVDREAIERIPAAERRDWLLMEKVEYAPALVTPGGAGVKVELRVLFLRPDGSKDLAPAVNLCRLSRAKMHGVDFNKDLDWVGSSVALWER